MAMAFLQHSTTETHTNFAFALLMPYRYAMRYYHSAYGQTQQQHDSAVTSAPACKA